jgi:hypothetical protein
MQALLSVNLPTPNFSTTAGENGWPIDQARPLLLAESHLTRRLFGAILGRIAAFALASRVGEPTTGSDFSVERGHGRAK